MTDSYEIPISEEEELEIFVASATGQALLCKKCETPLTLKHIKLISDALRLQRALKSYVEPLKIKSLLCEECFRGLYGK